MIVLNISKTSKSIGSQGEFRHFDQEELVFKSIAEAKAHLREEYGNCKRVPMFRDSADKTKPPIQCGYIYCFRGEEYDRRDGRVRWIQQDWVEVIRRIEAIQDVSKREWTHPIKGEAR